MTIKAIFFDADGVVLKKRDKYFSQRFIEDNNPELKIEEILKFFKNEYKDCILGKINFKEALTPYLEKWGWKKSIDELLQYWFAYENNLNNDVLDLVGELRKKGIKCYLASDHTEYRKEDLIKNVGLENYFDGFLFSCDLGFTKSTKEFFEKALENLDFSKEEVIFIDDEPENIQAAESAGIKSVLFDSDDALRNELSRILY